MMEPFRDLFARAEKRVNLKTHIDLVNEAIRAVDKVSEDRSVDPGLTASDLREIRDHIEMLLEGLPNIDPEDL